MVLASQNKTHIPLTSKRSTAWLFSGTLRYWRTLSLCSRSLPSEFITSTSTFGPYTITHLENAVNSLRVKNSKPAPEWLSARIASNLKWMNKSRVLRQRQRLIIFSEEMRLLLHIEDLVLRCYLIENEAVHLQSNQEQVVFLFSQCRSTIYVNYEETLVHTARVPLS